MAPFKIKFHFQFICPFIKCVKIFLECSCVCLRLKRPSVLAHCDVVVYMCFDHDSF